jgi:hypothetical protein
LNVRPLNLSVVVSVVFDNLSCCTGFVVRRNRSNESVVVGNSQSSNNDGFLSWSRSDVIKVTCPWAILVVRTNLAESVTIRLHLENEVIVNICVSSIHDNSSVVGAVNWNHNEGARTDRLLLEIDGLNDWVVARLASDNGVWAIRNSGEGVASIRVACDGLERIVVNSGVVWEKLEGGFVEWSISVSV